MAHFFFSKEKEAVTVNGDRYRALLNEYLFTKSEEEDIDNIWFQGTPLRATQPKLHLMFCVLFLKIALSVAELMSFGHLGDVISYFLIKSLNVTFVFLFISLR